MLVARPWLALGLAVAWSGVSLGQEAPEKPTAPQAPTPVRVYLRDVGGGAEAGAQASPYSGQGGRRLETKPTITQEVLLQDGSPGAIKLVSEMLASGESQAQWPLFFRGIPNEQGLGASFEPADESLRAQLDVPKDEGLVVTSVAPGGPAARIGIVANDIILTLADKPIGNVDDLSKAVKGTGEEPITLKLLRHGKAVTIQVKPEHHVTLGPVATTRTRYLLGVQVVPVEGALRSHLGLSSDDQGLLVSKVESGTPAEKGGIKKNDILLSIADKPLTSTESLVSQVQESRGKPIALKLLRSGKSQSFEIKPEERKETIDVTVSTPERTVFTTVRPTQVHDLTRYLVKPPTGAAPNQSLTRSWSALSQNAATDRQITELLREVRELRRSVDQLQKSLKELEDGGRKEK